MLQLAHALTCLLALPTREPRRQQASSAAAVAAGIARGVARDPRGPAAGGPFASQRCDGDDAFWTDLAAQASEPLPEMQRATPQRALYLCAKRFKGSHGNSEHGTGLRRAHCTQLAKCTLHAQPGHTCYLWTDVAAKCHGLFSMCCDEQPCRSTTKQSLK